MANVGKQEETPITKTSLTPKRNELLNTMELWVWGNGKDGSLGIKGLQEAPKPVQIPLPSEIKDIRDISVGKAHCTFCTSTGDCYSWGPSTLGQTGHGNTSPKPTPLLISDMKGVNVLKVASGATHTLFLTDAAKIFGVGSGQSGELGLSELKNELIPKINQHLYKKDVVQVSCGEKYSTCIVSPSMDVYGFGDNVDGQIASNDSCELKAFKIPELTNILKVACGTNHTLALSATGEIFSFGRQGNPALGHDPKLVKAFRGFVKPQKIAKMNQIIDIAAGKEFSLALHSDKSISSWGKNDFGQLGQGDRSKQLIPKRIDSDNQFVSVFAGSFHSAAITSSGELFTWGQGTNHKLGHGSTADELAPRLVVDLNIGIVRQVACGGVHTLAVIDRCPPFSRDFVSWISSNQYTDVQFEVEGRKFRCHKVFVCARSAFLDKLVSESGGKDGVVISLPSDILADDFSLVLQFLYTDIIQSNVPSWKRLEELATKLQIPKLITLTQEIQQNKSVTPQTGLKDSIISSLNDPKNSNFILHVDGKKIYTHKIILAARSRYFLSMFESGMKEKEGLETTISGFSYEAFFEFLKYCYGGNCQVSPENVVELVMISHQYRTPVLKQICEDYLRDNDVVESDSALSLWELSKTYDLPTLQQRCSQWFSKNFNSFSQTKEFLQLPEKSTIRTELNRKFGTKEEFQSSVADDLYDAPANASLSRNSTKPEKITKGGKKDFGSRSMTAHSYKGKDEPTSDEEYEEEYYDELEQATLESELEAEKLKHEKQLKKNYGLYFLKYRQERNYKRADFAVHLTVLEKNIESWEKGETVVPDKIARRCKIATFAEFSNFKENKL